MRRTLKVAIDQAVQTLTDLCQHMLNTSIVLNCVTVLKFNMIQ